MARSSKHGVSWHPQRNCYRAMVGGRTFYFGSDLKPSAIEADGIRAVWAALKFKGATAWPQGQPNRFALRRELGLLTASELAAAAVLADPTENPITIVPPNVSAPKTLASADALTLAQAANLYLASTEFEQGSRFQADVTSRLSAAVDSIGKDVAVNDIGQTELEAFVKHWAALPYKRRRNGTVSTTERIGSLYAKHIVTAAKGLFTWLETHQDIAWQAPKGLDRIMRIKAAKGQQTDWAEDERHFSIEELSKLFAAADSRMRCYMLIALNCGYYPEDIGDLKASHLVKDGDRFYLRNLRKKTGTKRQHLLWPETVSAIEAERNGTEGLLFVAPQGGEVDANTLQKPWARLQKVSGVKGYFKHLRHTSSHAVKEIADSETSSVHRANKGAIPMDAVYNAPCFDRLNKATEAMRERFSPIWA